MTQQMKNGVTARSSSHISRRNVRHSMLLPNKLYSYNESTLSKFPVVLKELRKEPLSVHELYRRVIKKMDGVNEFIDVLDCLYALRKIEYDENEEVLRYVV
ncbi:ABC-three component system middle component 7 [Lactobacillus delbrueckii]|uniref:ABC-three component system middle component 7 n=2 Tax=Bacteria TaxID=2 RepID=UPI003A8717B4